MTDTASFKAGPCGIQAKHKAHSGKRKDGTLWDCDGTTITIHAIIREVAPETVQPKYLASADWLGEDHDHPHKAIEPDDAWVYGQRAFVDGWDAAVREMNNA